MIIEILALIGAYKLFEICKDKGIIEIDGSNKDKYIDINEVNK